jgi:putative transposase
MAPCSKLHWRKRKSDPTRRIGEKNGSKRHLLVDGRGVPLSIIVTGAHRHDVTQLDAVLTNIVIKRDEPPQRRNKHLCADTAYVGESARATIEEHGYIPHVVPRKSEIAAKKRNPSARPRRWVVEVAHSWFNRFRKLLVRYEKTASSFLALNHLAAAIISFRKVPAKINVIYG